MVATAPQSETIDVDAAEPAFAAAAKICRREARGFYFASFFLPKAKRQAAHAAYAFCWMIADALKVSDSSINNGTGLRQHPAVVSPRHLHALPTDEQRTGCDNGEIDTRLAMFRDRLAEIYAGGLELPAVASRSEAQHALEAFSRTVKEYEIPQQYFLDLAEGCRVDAITTRYATWTRLESLCYHTGGVIALIEACALGATHSEAPKLAIKLGNAVKLTNLLRDVKKDRDRGRIYLPLEDMVRFRYSEADLAAGIMNDAFRALMEFEVARARKLFEEASEGISWLAEEGSRLAVAAVVMNSTGLLRAIEKQQYDVFNSTPALAPSDQLRRLPAVWRLARRRADEPLPSIA